MNEHLIKIEIIDNESLLKVCDILHDGYCDSSKIEYEQNNGKWKVIFERDFIEDQDLIVCETKLLVFNKISFPSVKSELRLEGIKTCEIKDKNKIQIYSFNECQVKNNVYKLLFNEGMEIAIIFNDRPKGSLVDQEILDRKRSIYQLRNPFKK